MQWQIVPIIFDQGLSQKTDEKGTTNKWLALENVVMEKSGKFQKRRGFVKGANLSPGTTLVESPNKTPLAVPLAGDCPLRVDAIIDLGIKTDIAPGTYANTSLAVGCMNRAGALAVLYAIRSGTYGSLRWRKFNSDFTVASDTELGNISLVSTRDSRFCGVSDTTAARGCVAVSASYRLAPNLCDVIVYVDGVEYVVQSNFECARLSAVGFGDYVYLTYLDVSANLTRVKRFNLTTLAVDNSATIAVTAQSTAMNISPDGSIVYVGASNIVYRFTATLGALSNGVTSFVGAYVANICRSGIASFTSGFNSYIETSLGRVPLYSTSTAFCSPVTVAGVEYLAFTAVSPGVQINPIASGIMYVKADATELASGTNVETHAFYSQAALSIGFSQTYGANQIIPTTGSLKLVKWTTASTSSAINVFGDPVYQTSTLMTLLGNFSGSRRAAPYGIPYAPTIVSVGITANDGSGYTTGKITFTAVLKETLPSGRVAYSAPSLPVEYTIGTANKTVNVTIATPYIEKNRAVNTTISLYAIIPGTTNYEPVVEGYPLNEYVTLESSVPIIAPGIYTSGGVLEDIPPPLCRGTMAVAKNRIWVMSAEYPEVRFSDELWPGEAPQFIEPFSLQLIPNGGDGMTVREIDGKVLVFQKYCISATFGDGQDQAGNNAYPQLQVIARDIGTINGNSVVTTNEGIFFLSSKGLWIVDRSLTVQFIGSAVENDALNIIAAAKLTDTEQIWFFTSSKAIIYDAFHQIWTTAPLGITGITDAKVIDGVLHILAGGYDYTLSGTSDDGTGITVKLKTGWIQLGGPQGYHRVKTISFLTEALASNTMTVKVYYDFSTMEFETFTVATANVILNGATAQWELKPKRQKAESMQIEISYSGTNAGVTFSNFLMEAARKDSNFKSIARIGGN